MERKRTRGITVFALSFLYFPFLYFPLGVIFMAWVRAQDRLPLLFSKGSDLHITPDYLPEAFLCFLMLAIIVGVLNLKRWAYYMLLAFSVVLIIAQMSLVILLVQYTMLQHMRTERVQRVDDLALVVSTRRHFRRGHTAELFDHGLDRAWGQSSASLAREDRRGMTGGRPDLQPVAQRRDHSGIQRHFSGFSALAQSDRGNAALTRLDLDIVDIQRRHFGHAQARLPHQRDHGRVTDD